MRRTRLVAAAFAGTVCLAALAPVAVAAEPVAEVSPRRVHPGGTVTLTVTCPKHDEKVRYITAYSQAFAEGEVKLKLVRGGSGGSTSSGSGGYGKATYRGSAKIASAHGFSSSAGSTYGSDAYGSDGSGEPYDSDSYGAEDSYGSGESDSYSSGSYGSDGSYDSDDSYGSGSYGSDDSYGQESSRRGKSFGINGSCPDGSDFTTSVIVDRKPRGGAHAGVGGSHREVNTAAVAAGGALVSATVGFGVYVLRRRRPGV